MSQIKKLDEAVINRIAAGEVIQRPANALKEMIENSLDARSTNIQITVKSGGLKLLQIQDNGIGIRKEDLEIVCERFTTSKLREFEDLNTIATYGFRGEALASISHCAHLTIITKTADEKCAYKGSYVDGKLTGPLKPSAGNQGTQIIIEDLFYNMNVRQRALKNPAEEYQRISDVVGKYAIHNADVGFSLKKQGENNDIRTPPNSTQVDNIRIIYGNLIARELIEFELANEAFKVKVRGYISNVNHSTKKLVFLLFINHRLVDCQSLKKCVDQVYSTYLPKHMHPFVYLSLELDPRHLDVNVHPTKHEVHFFHEDEIVDLISSTVEAKLLSCNNSRVFYTQTKLPGLQPETLKLADDDKSASAASKPVVHDKDLVRTDSSEQKITKFFGSADSNQCKADFLQKNEEFEKMIVDVTADTKNDENKAPEQSSAPKLSTTPKLSSTLISKVTRVETQLRSVLELRKEIETKCHLALREVFAQHVFVGCINPSQSLIQHGTKLYLCDTQRIMQELFYQFLLYNFQNFGRIALSNPLSVNALALIALDLPETGWEPEDGDKTELAQKITEILKDKGEMMKEYFNMEIDDEGNLKSLPILLENHTPDMSGLPLYLLRLATEVNWDKEKECFRMFANETALYYSLTSDEANKNWKRTTEHVLYPAVKEYFLPPKDFTDNAAVLEIADLPKLYKVFERC